MADKVKSAYRELAQRVAAGELRMISLLAPARSSSTALERALLMSPGVHLQVNDPFALYDDPAREQKTYEYILSRIEADDKTFGPMTVLVKNVGRLHPARRRLGPLARPVRPAYLPGAQPAFDPAFLVQMMVRHYTGDMVALEPLTMDEYARGKGHAGWAALQEKLAEGADFSEHEDLYRALFTRDQKIHRENVMRIPALLHAPEQVAIDAGYRSLDKFAASLGDGDWDATKQYLTTPAPDFTGFEKILERIFACRITGWEALYQHFTHTRGAFVMDSTMFRSAPALAMRAVAEYAGIKYADTMHAWQGDAKPFIPTTTGKFLTMTASSNPKGSTLLLNNRLF